MMIKELGLLFIVFISSVLLTRAMLQYAVYKSLLDIPNKRSLHSVSMPQGGGAAFVILYSIILLVFLVVGELDFNLIFSLLIGGLLVSGVGFFDDHKPLPARVRFIVHTLSAMLVIIMISAPKEITVNNLSIQLGLFGDLFSILFIVWLINLYNFMDGVDGIAGMEALCVTIGASVVIFMSSEYGLNYNLLSNEERLLIFILLSLAMAVAGFLVWNWPPAKIFMGDVGSGYLGFILSVLVIYTHTAGMVSIWVWFILFGVFFVDASITLLTRISTGQQWYKAHRSHAYQKLAQKWGSHRKVTLSILTINIIWLAPLALLANMQPDSGAMLTAIAYLPLLIIAFVLKAGRV